jgi:hypothetical protein
MRAEADYDPSTGSGCFGFFGFDASSNFLVISSSARISRWAASIHFSRFSFGSSGFSVPVYQTATRSFRPLSWVARSDRVSTVWVRNSSSRFSLAIFAWSSSDVFWSRMIAWPQVR